jgi:hypothetical protein
MLSFYGFCQLLETVQDYIPELVGKLQNNPDPNLFVHFSGIEKIGIYPAARRTGVAGLFAFPKSYVLNKVGNNPYFYTRGYAFIIKPRPNAKILKMYDMSFDWLEKLVKKLGLQELYQKAKTSGKPNAHSVFWEMMKSETAASKGGGAWIIRNAGYDALYDNGSGTMHSNEPYQIAFVNPVYDVVERINLTSAPNRFKKMAFAILQKAANQLFGEGWYKIDSSRHYSDKTLKAIGQIESHPFEASLTYYIPDKDSNNSFTARINLYSKEAEDNFGERRIEVRADSDENIDHQIKSIVDEYKEKISETKFRENKNDFIKPLIYSINKLLGLTKPPVFDFESGSITRNYKEGKIHIAVFYSDYGKNYHASLSIKTIDGATIIGNMDCFELEKNPKELAPKILQQLIQDTESQILHHYNPDYEQNKGDSYWKFKASMIGQKLMTLLNKIKSRNI